MRGTLHEGHLPEDAARADGLHHLAAHLEDHLALEDDEHALRRFALGVEDLAGAEVLVVSAPDVVEVRGQCRLPSALVPPETSEG
jgi:hypothetical protein